MRQNLKRMIKKLCLTLIVISTASLSMVSAQQTAKVTASGIGYLEYLPQGYHSNSKKYPVVISLHGVKEKGTPSNDRQKVLADLQKVDNVGLPRYVRQGQKYPFILISPQLKSNQGMWQPSYIISVLNHVRKQLRIDDRRIYLTGLSLGGFGVWRTAGAYPDVFAAIAPICAGGNDMKNAGRIAAHDLPIWGFHGNRDKIVSHNVTVKMINAVNSKRPNPLAKTTIFQGMGHPVWDKAYKDTNLLDWLLSQKKGSSPPLDPKGDNGSEEESSEDDSKKTNKPPVVKAGPDKTLTLPANSLQIRGSANDQDGKIESYKWTQVSGRSANLSGVNRETLKVTNLKEGTYVFRLTAKDDDGAGKADNVRVVVRKSSGGKPDKGEDDESSSKKNTPPNASAGPDRMITLPTNSITVRANASDKDGKIVSYEWVQTYGKRISMSGTNSRNLRVSNLKKGNYIVRLRVTDNDGAVDNDFFKITVKERSKNNSGSNNSGKDNSNKGNSKGNAKPVAYAGPDIKIKKSQGTVQLIGSARDADGRVVFYQWRKIAGPGGIRIKDARSPKTTLTNLKEGRYYFALTVKDDKNAVHVDKMALRVSK
jgi:dienelactone hydrolase